MKKLTLLFAFISLSLWGISQETHGARTVNYTVTLDRLKFEEQELKIEESLSKMEGVKSCDVDRINYTLKITVFEPKENNNAIGIDEIKIVLANNNVEIKNFTQDVKITD